MTSPRLLVLSLFASTLTIGCPKNRTDNNDTQVSSSSGNGSDSVTSAVASTDESQGSAPTTAITTTTGTPTTIDSEASLGECTTANCSDMMNVNQCDNWAQDCPEGEKCTAYIPSEGQAWTEAKCVDVTGTDKPGDTCTSTGAASGVDSCIKGAKCWNVDTEGIGTCVALCTGSPATPICDSASSCQYSGTLNLCIPYCNPLVQDCPLPDQACYEFGANFSCAPDVSGDDGQANDPCEDLNLCDKGLMCGDATFVGMGCGEGSSGCCTPFCEFPGGACPNADQECVQYFNPQQFPADDPLLSIGVCGVPS